MGRKLLLKNSQNEIVRLFYSVKSWRGFKQAMRLRDFKVCYGSYKMVFVHTRLDFVIKIVFGYDNYPLSTNPLSRYYLWPIGEPHERKFDDWKDSILIFQPKADCRNALQTFKRLKNRLRKKGLKWHHNKFGQDAHEGNVGLYKGKPVIIDY